SDRAGADLIDDTQPDGLVGQQLQGPARPSPRRLGTGQRNELGFFLAIENLRNGRGCANLAAQDRLEALLHQLLAYPVNHRCAGLQSLDDPAVAPAFSRFGDISLQQDPRFQLLLGRTLPLADQLQQPSALFLAQPHDILLHRNRFCKTLLPGTCLRRAVRAASSTCAPWAAAVSLTMKSVGTPDAG